MTDDLPYGREALRERFPWVGLGTCDEADHSSRYREVMADSLRNREIVEAGEKTLRETVKPLPRSASPV